MWSNNFKNQNLYISNVRDENGKYLYLFVEGMHWKWKIDTRSIYYKNLVNILQLYVWV